MLTTLRTRLVAGLALVLLAAGLVPVFQANILGTATTGFFEGWDQESQALVLGKIQQDAAGARSSWGLVWSDPDHFAPYASADFGGTSGTTPARWTPYTSQLGAQGYLFEGLHRAGCTSVSCLTTASSSLFAGVLVLFVCLLAAVTRRSFALVVLAVALTSPWVVAGARNLYWVPWTWLLPACAAAWFVLARSRRTRIAAGVAVAVAVAVKAATGYEFITCVVILAAGMPVLAAMLGPARRPWRSIGRDVAVIMAVALLGFLVVLTIQVLEAGSGNVVDGLRVLAADATKRTYGTASSGMDETTVISLRISPVTVLGMYVFAWKTDVLSLHLGTPLSFDVAGAAFWPLLVAAGACVLVGAVRRSATWRRDLVLLGLGAAAPISWIVLAKAHAYTATYVDFVLWYLLLVPILLWVLGSAAMRTVRSARAARLRGNDVVVAGRALVRRPARSAADTVARR